MGFSLVGVALNKKFETADKLLDELGVWNATKVADTNFEAATSSAEQDDIYITEVSAGTILFFGRGLDPQEMTMHFITKGIKGLTFMIGETAMIFSFEYYEDGQRLRHVLYADGMSVMEEGKDLEAEKIKSDKTGLIFYLIEEITGESFYNISPDTKSLHYKKVRS